MYSARRAVGWVSTIYFVSLIVLGMMIMMSLFLAILLSNFATPEQDEADAVKAREARNQQEQEEEEGQQPWGDVDTNLGGFQEERENPGETIASQKPLEGIGTVGRADVPGGGLGTCHISHFKEEPFRNGKFFAEDDDDEDEDDNESSPTKAARRALSRAQQAMSGSSSSFKRPSVDSDSDGDCVSGGGSSTSSVGGREETKDAAQHHQDRQDHLPETHGAGEATTRASKFPTVEESTQHQRKGDISEGPCSAVAVYVADCWHRVSSSLRVPDPLFPGLALCCLSAENPLRRGCAALVSNAGFGLFITFLIAVSSISLALDNPLRDPDSSTARILQIIEIVTAVFFTIEFLLKICASGFYFMPMAYLRDGWNVVDFFVVLVVLVEFATIGPNLVGLRSLRALRALRPLR